jgi:circadian clock protein KaiB
MLRLYITGTSPRSMRAISNLKEVCESYLKGWYTLEVIDLYQQPALAERDQILAAPTLVKRLPVPLKRLIGDMSDKDKILVGLDIKPNTP